MILKEEVIGRSTIMLHITGDLDAHTADEFRQSLATVLERDIRKKNLILDMKNVNFIDSSGLGVILGRYRAIQMRRGKIIITSPQPHVKKILEFSGITRVVPVVSDKESARDLLEQKGVE